LFKHYNIKFQYTGSKTDRIAKTGEFRIMVEDFNTLLSGTDGNGQKNQPVYSYLEHRS
jgi:hypothetical protein